MNRLSLPASTLTLRRRNRRQLARDLFMFVAVLGLVLSAAAAVAWMVEK